MSRPLDWAPAALLLMGALVTLGVSPQRRAELTHPLGSGLPGTIGEYQGTDVELSAGEVRAAGVTAYLYRNYQAADPGRGWFSLYVGYYDRQEQGKTIHSPKNCLPGGGWEALQSSVVAIPTSGGPATVNRYLLQKGEEQALVLYWYQGRGRVQANEYLVKWNLLWDAALRHRTEEALVRIVVPMGKTPEETLALAKQAAEIAIPGVATALPR